MTTEPVASETLHAWAIYLQASEEAYKPKGHRKFQVTGSEVLAQISALEPPDPAAVLLDALGVNTAEVQRRLGLPSEAEQETSSMRPAWIPVR